MSFESSYSCRDLVLNLLFEDWPLSAKEIFEKVKKSSNKTVSYQAIHKVLKVLLEEQILLFKDMKYSVDPRWVKQMKKQYSNIESKLLKKENSFDSSKVLSFENANLSLVYTVLSTIEQGLEFISTKERDVLDYEYVFDASVMFKMKDFFNNPILNKNIKKQLSEFRTMLEENKVETDSEIQWNFESDEPVFNTFLVSAYMTPSFLGHKHITKSVNFLINNQRADGSWFERKNKKKSHYHSAISVTSNILWVLRNFGGNSIVVKNSIKKAVKFLEDNRIKSGKNKGFWLHEVDSAGPDWIYPTYIVLYELGQHNKSYLEKYDKQVKAIFDLQDISEGCWHLMYYGRDEKIVGTYMGLALLIDSVGDIYSDKVIKGLVYICNNATPSGKIGKHPNVTAIGLHRLIGWLKAASYL